MNLTLSGDTPFLNRFVLGPVEDDLSYVSRAAVWIADPDEAKMKQLLNETKLKAKDLPFTQNDDVSTYGRNHK